MDIERGNLDILFHWIPYNNITTNELNVGEQHDSFHVNQRLYLDQCHHVFAGRSEDERINCYAYLQVMMAKKKCYKPSVFQLVLNAAECFLIYQSGDVLCKFEQLLRWREISLNLGQDLFVCAYLADHDLQWREERRNFSWLPIIMSDNRRIQAVLRKGIAENHFHLKGSSRIFELNWICLMNHISGREKEFRMIEKEMQHTGICRKNFGNTLYEKCQKAALYRLYLFHILRETNLSLDALDSLLLDKQRIDIYISELQDAIERARLVYGADVSLTMGHNTDGRYFLDYAFRKELHDFNQNSYRILTGERSFLYACFQACFTQRFSEFQQNIFYRYLKLRIEFRQELIQVNQEVGFKNFSDYEGRKEYFVENYPAYMNEFLTMAIKGQLEREHLKYLEMRVTPKSASVDLYKMLKRYHSVDILQNEDAAEKIRYVMHFPKGDDKQSEIFPEERNRKIRQVNKFRARALVKLMQSHSHLRLDVVGIDACANEIGCRPETFGQIFRYLSHANFSTENSSSMCSVGNTSKPKQLSMTYHVGEDFLDIVDGLRAIDEAILFCGLKRGSRIGHALALGIEPTDYYSGKVYQLLLPKQDLMDDIAWMIYMANAHGCTIDACLHTKLLQKFQELFQDVYQNYYKDYMSKNMQQQSGMSILDYYQSWKLRGDAPVLYRLAWDEFQRRDNNQGNELEIWERFAFNSSSDIPEELRKVHMYYQLNKYYAFDYVVRKHGKEVTAFKVDSAYIDLVRQLQDCMIHKLVKKGIAIETNPSSNYLIGTIKRYDQHPILRFNSRKLEETTPNMSLSVSLNTDDQGVFDTLLENEYALMVLALKKAKDENGKDKYDIENIYEWLDYVREMGLEQVFEK